MATYSQVPGCPTIPPLSSSSIMDLPLLLPLLATPTAVAVAAVAAAALAVNRPKPLTIVLLAASAKPPFLPVLLDPPTDGDGVALDPPSNPSAPHDVLVGVVVLVALEVVLMRALSSNIATILLLWLTDFFGLLKGSKGGYRGVAPSPSRSSSPSPPGRAVK